MYRFIPLVLIALLGRSTSTSAQEICDNGTDDDADGWVDLNDTLDCSCASGVVQLDTIIPNPMLEDTLCCPHGYSEMACCAGWIQPTLGTCDYFHQCDYFPEWMTTPLPDGGEACMGGYMAEGYKEYVSTCLEQSLIPDSSYALTFHVAAFLADNEQLEYVDPIDFGAVELTLFGQTVCGGAMLEHYLCPEADGWSVLGTVLCEPNEDWQPLTLHFTPEQAVQAIMLGAPCDLPEDYGEIFDFFGYPYFVYDAFSLQTHVPGASLITSTGTLCLGDLVLSGAVQGALGQQWYLNGVAMVGQTANTLAVSQLGLAEGNYQLVATLDASCLTLSTTVLPPIYPVPEIELTFNGNLNAPEMGTYQWYLDGVLLPDETDHLLEPEADGDYTVSITNAFGCEATSPPFTLPTLGVPASGTAGVAVIHAPGSEEIIVRGAQRAFRFALFDANGRCVVSTTGSSTEWHWNIAHLPAGLYVALVEGRATRLLH